MCVRILCVSFINFLNHFFFIGSQRHLVINYRSDLFDSSLPRGLRSTKGKADCKGDYALLGNLQVKIVAMCTLGKIVTWKRPLIHLGELLNLP